MKKLKIDNEFKNLIPPLTKEEYKQLEENLIEEGCRDSLVTWNDTIVDGHNRYEICTNPKHIIPFSVREMDFESRDEAKEWIIRNQFGRRNLPAYERAKLALKLEETIKKKAKENQIKSGGAVPQKSAKPIETRKELAKLAGVSHDTIDKVKVIEEKATTEQKEELSKGTKKINTVFKEIKANEETKVCTKCGIEKPISEFYKGRNQCKKCVNAAKIPVFKDFKGNVIKGGEKISNELVEAVDKSIHADKSKIIITSDYLVDDLESFSSAFIRNANRTVKEYNVTVTPENNKKIIATLSEVEEAIKNVRERFVYE